MSYIEWFYHFKIYQVYLIWQLLVGQGLEITTPLGRYSAMDNTTFGSSSNQFTAQFIEMNQPIHESFFYEWYLVCLNSGFTEVNKKQIFDYPFPRLDFAIKYFNQDEMNPSIYTKVTPTFVYWIMRSLSNISRNI